MALAEGGYQMGELAKFLVCNDLVREKITINEFDYDKSFAQTKAMREKGGKVVIAEATFAISPILIYSSINPFNSLQL